MARYAGNAPYIYLNGAFVPDGEARIDLLSVAVKYAGLVFEGIVAHLDQAGKEVLLFRLGDHVARLLQSMRILRFAHDYSAEHLADVVIETLRRNEVRRDAHIRLNAFVEGRGPVETMGPIGLACSVAFRPERTLDDKVCRAAVSSWRRIDDSSMPPRVKTAANYSNGRLALLQAKADGYDEVVLLNQAGKVAEASSSCLFIVRDGVLATPARSNNILESITRDSIVRLMGRDLGVAVAEREIDRTELYVAEEAFICGSGYEVAPVVAVDGLEIGGGQPGPLTRRAWQLYEAALRGGDAGHRDWLTPVWAGAPARRAAGS